MFRRHPVLTLIGLLLLAVLAPAVAFVATFDLNSHRERLARELSRALQAPVSIGKARLSLHEGVALDFGEVRIGDAQTPLSATIEHLYLHLELRPLLHREISITQIELGRPDIRLSSMPEPAAQAAPLRLPGDPRIHSLAIRDGRLSWHPQSEEDKPLTLSGIDGELHRLDEGGNLRLEMAAQVEQKEQPARVRLAGTLSPRNEGGRWQDLQFDLQAQGHNLDLGQTSAFWPARQERWSLAGLAALEVEVRSSPDGGLLVKGQVQGKELRIQYGEKLLPLHSLALDAQGFFHESRRHLELRNIHIDQARVEGTLEFAGGEQPVRVRGQLALPPLNPALALPWLVFAPPEAAARLTALKPRNGTLQLQTLILDGPVTADSEAWLGPQGTLRDLTLIVRELDLDPPQGEVRRLSGDLRYTPGQLEINAGQLRWREHAVRVSGRVDAPFSAEPRLALALEGKSGAAELLAAITPLPATMRLAGDLAWRLELGGAANSPLFSLDADLAQVRLSLEDWLEKPAGTPFHLRARGQWRAGLLLIEDAPGRCGPLAFNLTGSMEPHGHGGALRLNLHESDLGTLPDLAPRLAAVGLAGKIAGHLDLAWAEQQLKPLQGEFALRDGGADFRGIVGDLNGARGRILLSGNEVRLADVSARLGESSLQLRGRIADLRAPRLELDVEGSDLRPEDLIFPGTEGRLTSVAGRLVIDGEGIAFSPVDAQTAGGTRARVTGAVRDYSRPRVDLKIVAEYGNVDEILVFFRNPQQARRAPRQPGKLQVRIEVEAAGGVYHNIHFKNGAAVIRYQNRTLDIYPLHADLDPGYYVGRVLWAHRGDQPPLLVVSGTVQDGDAEKLYRSQTDARGLVGGKLRGAFYLEGAGNHFWPTARGGLTLEVRDGVLRRFQVLSKVFSLLNVSQIFALRLPDMSLEGMPFSLLSANALVRDGRLTTEDLFIESPAMNLSLVGETDLAKGTIDALLGVKPLRTVDKIVTRIPIAGWVLTGEEKALITAHFKVVGNRADPSVYPVPVTSLSEKVFGIFRRVLGLPGKVITDIGQALQGEDAGGD